MNRNLRTIAAAALSLAVAGAALAQPAQRGGGGMKRILDGLQLTDAQRQKVEPMLQGQRAAMRDMREKTRTDRQALRSAAQAANPDPAAVGQAFLAVKADRQAAKAQRQALRAQIATVLTPEQNAKLDAFFAGMRAGRRMHGGGGMGGGMAR